MSDDVDTLSEVLFGAETFCFRIEAMSEDLAPSREREEVRLKLGQCRNLMSQLQGLFDEDKLVATNGVVQTIFRTLITNLLWVSFYMRHVIDRKSFRILVTIQYAFNSVLANNARARKR